jgi:hypothetical protein
MVPFQAFRCLEEKGLIESKPTKVDNVSQTIVTGNNTLLSLFTSKFFYYNAFRLLNIRSVGIAICSSCMLF